MGKDISSIKQEENNYGLTVTITVLLLGILNYSSSIAGPILSTVAQEFPDISPTTIKTISTVPMLMQCIFAPVAGIMTRKLSVKKCLIISCLFIITGIIPVFTPNFTMLMLSRCTYGIGFGIGFPMVSVAIAELFTGGKRTSLMGAKSAVGSVGGIILQTLSGYIAVYNWQLAFIPHLFALLILVPIIFFLPDTGEKKKENAGSNLSFVGARYIIIVAFALCLNVLQMTFMQDVSFVLTESEMGNSAGAAIVLNVFSAFAFIGGILHGWISSLFKRYTIIFAGLMTGIAFVIGMNAGNVIMLYVMAAFFGIGFSTSNPGFVLMVTDAAGHKENISIAVSIHMACTGLGQFLSPYFHSFCRTVLNNSQAVFAWKVAAIGILLGTAVGCILLYRDSKRKALIS